jgi:site-specific DNA recombinase
MNDQKGKRVGIWIRVSTEDQAKGDSPEHHKKRAEAYALLKDWSIVEVYDLSGVSGKSVKDHPEAVRMFEDVKRGHIQALIFSKLARLARNTRDLLDISEYFQQYDAELISLGESIDTSTSAGRLFFTVISALAQFEREEISERVKASVPIRASMNKSVGGTAPFGYQWKDGTLQLHPEEAKIRAKMFDVFLTEGRLKSAARKFNEMGFRTRNGSTWSDTTFKRLLTDTIAKGKRRANYTSHDGDSKTIKPEDQWVYIDVEPIVSEEIWQRANDLLAPRKRTKKPARKPTAIFTGLIHCGCGGVMRVPSNSPKYVCKDCRSKIPQADIEEIFAVQLKDFLLSPQHLDTYLESAQSKIKTLSDELEVLLAEEGKIDHEVKKQYELYLSDAITASTYGRMCKPLEQRREEIEIRIEDIKTTLTSLKNDYSDSQQMKNDAFSLYERWKQSFDKEQKRTIVEAIVENITVHTDSIDIKFHFSPFLPTDGNLATQQFRGALPGGFYQIIT